MAIRQIPGVTPLSPGIMFKLFDDLVMAGGAIGG